MLQSFIPNKNMSGMYNFKVGQGASPSFFFFSDNNMLMLKTLKESEDEILFKKGFLAEYFKYIMENPDTLIMKIFGAYQLEIGKSKVAFVLTENMIGLDKSRVKRCFDLKGSKLGRVVKTEDKELLDGTGMKVLKEGNFLKLNELAKAD